MAGCWLLLRIGGACVLFFVFLVCYGLLCVACVCCNCLVFDAVRCSMFVGCCLSVLAVVGCFVDCNCCVLFDACCVFVVLRLLVVVCW